jgi:hypothetical protein
MTLLTEFGTKKGDRIGDHKINAVPPCRQTLYPRKRLIMPCGHALAGGCASLRLDQFNRDVPNNPWGGVTKKRREWAPNLRCDATRSISSPHAAKPILGAATAPVPTTRLLRYMSSLPRLR